MSGPPQPFRSSKEILAEQQAQWRREKLEKAKGPQPTIDEMRAIAEAAVQAAHAAPPAMAPLGAKLPRAARMALDAVGRVFNPKIHAKDVERFQAGPIRVLPWLDVVAAKLRQHRKVGDVLPSIIRRVADVIGWAAHQTAKVEKTFKQIAEQAHCCIETARKAVRWLEAHDLLDTFNTLRRVGNDLERGPNLYLPVMPADAPVPAGAGEPGAGDAPAEKLAPLARAEARLNRWAARFGLVPRAWGLNATPIATKHQRSGRDPEPA